MWGETATVDIPVDTWNFRHWNEETKVFEVEEGEYEIQAGSSSQKNELTETLMVK